MSKKHNTKHNRGKSHYPERLAARLTVPGERLHMTPYDQAKAKSSGPGEAWAPARKAAAV